MTNRWSLLLSCRRWTSWSHFCRLFRRLAQERPMLSFTSYYSTQSRSLHLCIFGVPLPLQTTLWISLKAFMGSRGHIGWLIRSRQPAAGPDLETHLVICLIIASSGWLSICMPSMMSLDLVNGRTEKALGFSRLKTCSNALSLLRFLPGFLLWACAEFT